MNKTMNSMKPTLGVFLFLLVPQAFSQVPVPAKAQEKPILLEGGTAHLGNGKVIENALIAFENGKLTYVGEASSTQINRESHQVIPCKGKHIYPGFILPNTQLGLTEVSSVRATIDFRERGSLNPNVRTLRAYNTDSEIIPTLRFNGVLMAQSTPVGGVISGTSSIFNLDGWNWEDAVFRADDGIHMNWPSRFIRRFSFATFQFETQPNKDYQETMEVLDRLFREAKAYNQVQDHEHHNLKLASMGGLFDGKQRLFIHTNDAKEMIESIRFAQKMGVQKTVIVGGSEAWLITDFLKEHAIPIVLSDVHNLPAYPEEDIHLPFKLPRILQEQGIAFCLGYRSVANSRNLAFFAGTAAAYGLDREVALQKITLATAEILGIDDRVGSLETGKDATLFVSVGDALDMRTNRLEWAFIQGKTIQVEGRQQALFHRFQNKYGHGE